MSSNSDLTIESTLSLPNSSLTIPRLGFGIYQSPTKVCVASCLHALKSGYRHIDSAQFYANESEMGEAVRQSGIPREEVYLTTKILSPGGSPEKTYKKCADSVKKIDPRKNGYVDLFLIHSPSSGTGAIKEMWQALEQLKEEGKAKSIGVSNFGVGRIEGMKGYAKIWPPQVNQIELHPFCQQRTITSYCAQHSIVIEAYCPLIRNQKANHPTLTSLASSLTSRLGRNVTVGQVLIRWSLQKGFVPLPKSDNPGRIKENAGVYRWELVKEEMETLDGLDQGAEGAIVQAVRNE